MTQDEAPTPDPERRNTRQREAIGDAIRTAGQPLLPQEIHALARAALPALGIATVYRNLKLLQEAGEIVAVDLPGEPPRYEQAQRGHHHHFRCGACHQVFDVHGCAAGVDRMAPPGFAVERHEITLYGTCAACVRAQR